MNPSRISRKTAVTSAAVLALALSVGGGTAYALSDRPGEDERPIPAADRQRAEDAALAETGNGTVTDTELDDEDSRYEVEVTLEDGREVDVALDDSFDVVATETDGPDDDGGTDDDTDDTGDTGDTDDTDARVISAAQSRQAEQAALAETGGGTVTSTEADDLDGYEVEVTLDDGTEVDVRLDADYDVVSTGPGDGNDGNDGDDGNDE